jgi:hypothetical protein
VHPVSGKFSGKGWRPLKSRIPVFYADDVFEGKPDPWFSGLPSEIRQCRYGRFPETKLVYDKLCDSDESYRIAPLDKYSMWNGVIKYDKLVYPLDGPTHDECVTLLNWLDYLVGPCFQTCEQWTPAEAIEALDKTKACGPPYCWIAGPTKGDALKHWDFIDFWIHFWLYDQCSNATLKDELRHVSKLYSRLFIPANACMVTVGNYLFGAQNESLSCTPSDTVQIGLSTPGPDAMNLWDRFSRAIGRFIQGDGKGHDTKLCLALIIVAREFRKRHLNPKLWKAVDRFYDLTYCMHVNVRGHILELLGQQSGQSNTASDNTLITLMLILLTYLRKGLGLNEFLADLHVVMGDDFMLNSTHITEIDLDSTWNYCGMYLEIPGINQKFSEMTFMGMRPWKDGYHYNVDRTFNSINFYKAKRTVSQRFDKLISLTQNVYYSDMYEVVRGICVNYYKTNRHLMPPDEVHKLSLIQPFCLFKLYTGMELD